MPSEVLMDLLPPMLALLFLGLVWVVLRGVLRLASKVFFLGCGTLAGLGLAWALISLL